MPEILPPLPSPGDWDYRSFAPVPFADFAREFLALYEPPLRSRATYVKMRQVLELAARMIGPDGTTADLTPTFVAGIVSARGEDGAARTTHTLLSYLRVACKYAKTQGYLRTSPFEFRSNWVRVGRPSEGKHHSREEIGRVLGSLAAEVRDSEGWARWRARRLLAVASTFAYTGLRRQEGLMLHVGDLDLENRMIHLVERDGRRFKTEASAQPIPMAGPLAAILEDWLGHRMDVEPGFRVPRDCPYLFPNVSRSNFWSNGPTGHKPLDQLKAAGERAGVAGLTFLSLRHSFATHAEAWGISPAMLQRILRHTSLGTQDHYRHSDESSMRDAAGRIGFGPPPGPDAGGGPAS